MLNLKMYRKVNKVLMAQVILAGALSLSGCKSQQIVGTQKVSVSKSDRESISALTASPVTDQLQAKATYTYGGISMSGQLKMVRGQAVQMNVTLLGLKELARIDFRPDYMVVYITANKQFCKMNYEDIPMAKGLKLDYNTIEQLFWNRMFVPGVSADASQNFFSVESQIGAVTTFKERSVGYRFDVNDGNLVGTSLSKLGYKVQLDYNDFQLLIPGTGRTNRLVFPAKLVATGSNGNQVIKGQIALSNFQTSKVNLWQQGAVNYRELTPEQLVKTLQELL